MLQVSEFNLPIIISTQQDVHPHIYAEYCISAGLQLCVYS